MDTTKAKTNSVYDLIATLRTLRFPECARAALEQLASIHQRGGFSSLPGVGADADEIESQIIKEFVLFQSSKRKLNPIQDLQVIEILLKFCSSQSNDAVRHSVFKSMFGKANDNEHHVSLLSKLISMAVGVKNTNALNSASIWMQSQSCNSDVVLRIVADVINDYTNTCTDTTLSPLKQLPTVSAHFTCNLLTAITCMYSVPGMPSRRPSLPKQLLQLICNWLSTDPQLCLISLFQLNLQYAQLQRAALWTSPTKPNTQTPIPGLTAELNKQSQSMNSGETASASSGQQWTELWSRLHLLVLQSIILFPSLPGARQLELITLADMNHTVNDVVALVQKAGQSKNGDTVQLAVDRLVQVLQVALATGAFRCSLSDLRGICQRIPPCRLLKIVESQHLSSAPPPMHNAS